MTLRKDLALDLTATQRTNLHSLMHDYLKDDVVIEHFFAHHGAPLDPAELLDGLHAFTSHRELIQSLEDYLAVKRDAADPRFDPLFLPFPSWNPASPIPAEFQDVRLPDNPSPANAPWSTATTGIGPISAITVTGTGPFTIRFTVTPAPALPDQPFVVGGLGVVTGSNNAAFNGNWAITAVGGAPASRWFETTFAANPGAVTVPRGSAAEVRPSPWPNLANVAGPFATLPSQFIPPGLCDPLTVPANATLLWHKCLPPPAVCPPPAPSVTNDIAQWHAAVHDGVGGSMLGSPTTMPFREGAYIFLPWHAYIDEIYWNYQQCPGHGFGPGVGIPGWFGDDSQGGAIDVGKILGTSEWDLVVFHIDHSGAGPNQGFYRIGWQMDGLGNVTDWSQPILISGNDGAGSVGTVTTGAGIALGPIRPGEIDMVVFWVEQDIAGNHAKYQVAWNLGTDGLPQDGWSAVKAIQPDPFASAGGLGIHGAGIALGDISLNGQMDLIVFRVEHPAVGANQGFYRIGWDLVAAVGANAGNVTSWTGDKLVGPGAGLPIPPEPMWFSTQAQGADVTVADTHGDGMRDLIFFYVDHFASPNRGYYRIAYHLDSTTGDPEAEHGFFDQDGHTHGWGRVRAVVNPGPGRYTEMATRPADDAAAARLASLGADSRGAGVAFVQAGLASRPAPAQGDLIFFHLDNPAGPNRGYYRVARSIDGNGEMS
jgi:hypothetical protein